MDLFDVPVPLVRVDTFPDGRITVVPHSFAPRSVRGSVAGRGRPHATQAAHAFMVTADYLRLLRRWHRELWGREFDFGDCRFVTLSLDRVMDWQELTRHVSRLLLSVSRTFADADYLRTVEVQPRSKRFHVHFIFGFPVPTPTFTADWIDRHWKQGKIHVRPVTDIRAVMQYLTKRKDGASKTAPTLFPRGARVVAMSHNFGKVVVPVQTFVSKQEASDLVRKRVSDFYDGKGKFVRMDEHRFIDPTTGEIRRCSDRVYLPSIGAMLLDLDRYPEAFLDDEHLYFGEDEEGEL
jgi:hypothetical protein